LDYRYKTIFKFKRNVEKLIDSWDVKIEKNWRKINWEDPFSCTSEKDKSYHHVHISFYHWIQMRYDEIC
jgi:hypothetical protein